METLKKAIIEVLKPRALGFLSDARYREKMEDKIRKKIRRISSITLGKELEVSVTTKLDEIPYNSYELYKKYYEDPRESHFLYNINDYVTTTTSGTMGRPKKYLLPKTAFKDNMGKTGLSSILVATHDGEKITFEIGDVAYTNVPGGNQIAAHLTEIAKKRNFGFVKNCPDPNLPFQTKVDYFVDNYKNIDMTFMTVTSLLDEIYPRIGEPFHLKAFMTQDASSRVFKDEIMKITGSYPKTTYGSTETLFASVASIEHPGCYIFDWRVIYPEFLPEDEALDHNAPIFEEKHDSVKLDEVEPGKRYQLVATPYLMEMTRYIMPDIMECIDTGDDVLGSNLPVFRYHARSDKIMVLHNFTRIAEEELLQVLKDAGVPFVDFTVKKELEGSREFMRMYLELSQPMDKELVYKKIDDRLTEFDRDWHDLKSFLKFHPLKIELLPKNSFRNYLYKKHGAPRIERIEMREERLKMLLNQSA